MNKLAIGIIGVQIVAIACGWLYDMYDYLFVPHYTSMRSYMRGVSESAPTMFIDLSIKGKEVPYPVIGLLLITNLCCLVVLILNEKDRPNKSIQRRP